MEAARKSWRRPDILWLSFISVSLVLALLPFSSYIASIPVIRAEWGMSNSQSAVVFSAYLAGQAVASVVLLPVTDRIPLGRALFAGTLLLVVGNLLFPMLARDVLSGCALRFVAGAGHIVAYVVGVRLVSLRFAGRMRGTAVAVFVGVGYGGTTLSYVFMGQLLEATDSWQAAYLLTALAGIPGVALAALLMLGEERRGPPSQLSATSSGILSPSVLRHRPLLLANAAYALHTAELYIARVWLPMLLAAALVRQGRQPLEAAALAATWSGFMFASGIAGVILGGMLSDRIGRTLAAGVIFAASGAASFAVGWMVDAPMPATIALGFVYGFVTAADSAIYSTAVTELAPRELIGSTQAVQSALGFTAGALAPVVAGFVLDFAHGSVGWGLAFSFNGMLAVAGVLSLLLLRRMPDALGMADGRR